MESTRETAPRKFNFDLNEMAAEVIQNIVCTIKFGRAKPTIEEVLNFCLDTDPENDPDVTKYQDLLLDMIDVCASQRLDDRQFVREILRALYWISGRIDRGALYWDCQEDGTECKRAYMLEQVAGWTVDSKTKPWNRNTPGNFYLDLPFARKPDQDGHPETQILADAMYHKEDPELVLSLLRHGVQASCLYLWPVALTLDLRLTLCDTEAEIGNISSWPEMRHFRYFRRATSGLTIQVLSNEDNKDRDDSMSGSNGFGDTVLFPSRVMSRMPEDLMKSNRTLQHRCRFVIRQSLLLADNIPKGIAQLPLPRLLLQYIDLLED